MPDAKVVIKKYGNRRLYDVTDSRYVNLEDMAAMVREGREIQVLDARTGEDLTRVVLTQIIMDEARERGSGLPLDLLRQLVLATGRAGQEGLTHYLRSVLDGYRRSCQAFQHHMQQPSPAPLNPLEFVQSLFPFSASPAAPAPQRERAEAEIEELRRRVEELEQALGRPARKSGRGPAKRRRAVRP